MITPFWERYRIDEDGCWLWTGNIKAADGYGRSFDRDIGQWRQAHRRVYEKLVGPIPVEATLDHECHNEAARSGECAGGPTCKHRSCVNPDHIKLATMGDNTRASANTHAGKTHCKNGHPFDDANTYVSVYSGMARRVCRACSRAAQKRSKMRRKLSEARA